MPHPLHCYLRLPLRPAYSVCSLLAACASVCARACPHPHLHPVTIAITNISANPTAVFGQRRLHTSSRALAGRDQNGVPEMGAYKTSNQAGNKLAQYFMVGALGALSASGAKSMVSDILSNMGASADVLALAKIEVEMGSIPEGELRGFMLARS